MFNLPGASKVGNIFYGTHNNIVDMVFALQVITIEISSRKTEIEIKTLHYACNTN